MSLGSINWCKCRTEIQAGTEMGQDHAFHGVGGGRDEATEMRWWCLKLGSQKTASEMDI